MSIFSIKLAAFLAGFSAAVAASPAATTAAPPTNPTDVSPPDVLSVMGQGPLDQVNYAAFAECIGSLDTSYRAYEDAGMLVIIPPANRTVDIETTDAALWQCIESSADTISLVLESAEFFDEAHENSTAAAAIQHTDAVAMGVTGQIVVDTVSTQPLQKRGDAEYYYVHKDSDSDKCQGDYAQQYIKQCYTFPSSFKSISAGNEDAHKTLKFSIWPHHDCSKGNSRTIAIHAKTQCLCQVRTTYSWNANY